LSGVLVAVGRPAAEIASFDLGLGGHRGANPDLHPVPLALRDTAEHRHDQIVSLVVRVDGSADLGHPQRHAVVSEQRERVAELIAVKGPLRLADHHGIKPAAGVGQRREQRGGLRPALRRDRAGLVDIEELGHDPAAARLDQALGPGDLPGTRRLGVLVVLSRHAAPERQVLTFGCDLREQVFVAGLATG
jgi:hypothetical protein